MKRYVLPVLMLLSLSLLCADLLNNDGSALGGLIRNMTGGTMNFSVRTATYNGAYAPRNAGAIWITNSQGQFVKTIKVWASQYRYTLIRWVNSSSNNTQGAITGASLNNHQLHNISWNGTNYQGTEVPDGDYKVNVEFTEHNASASNMGKFKQVTFTKGSSPVNLTIPNETYFRDMSLTWTPIVVNGTLRGIVTGANDQPLSGAVIMAGANSVFSSVNGDYSLSLPPGAYDVTCMLDGYNTQTINGVVVNSAQTTTLNISMLTVSNEDDYLPEGNLMLSSAHPNPFAGQTSLDFSAKLPGRLTAQVYNVKGQQIRNLQPLSSSTVTWDGQDDNGRYCPNGVYFIRVSSGNTHATRRVILNK